MTASPAMKKKSSAAFRTIGEVAAELGLPQHVLRFWESKFKHIKPHKRRGGHRYYRPQDIDSLKELQSLLYEEGFTIKGAQKYLSNRAGRAGDENGNENENDDNSQPELFTVGSAVNQNNKNLNQQDTARINQVIKELYSLKELLSRHL